MKILTLFLSLIPFVTFANFDGAYQNTYQENHYICEFSAELNQDKKTISLDKWNTKCSSPDGSYSTTMNGPVKFTILENKKVEVAMKDEVSVYDTTAAELNENKFRLNYNFEAYLEGEVLKYEVFFEFTLFNNILKYKIEYKQNGQVIFNDEAVGNKIH